MADFDWLTRVCALLGAGLSSYQWWERRRDRQLSVRVSLRLDVTVHRAHKAIPVLWIQVRNAGMADVHFKKQNTEIEISGSDSPVAFLSAEYDIAFPAVLKPGDAFEVTNPRQPLIDTLRHQQKEEQWPTGFVRIRAVVSNSARNTFNSPWVDIDLSEWKD